MSTYLGIDLGTTAAKAALVDADGTVLARSRVAHPESRSVGVGRADPRAWMSSIRDACHSLGTAATTAQGVGIAAHCPTALLFDVDGAPLADGLTWEHPALVEYTARSAALVEDGEQHLAGNRREPATFMVAAHAFFGDHEHVALAKAHRLGLVGSWLGQWLTGESGLDATQASYTGSFATMSAQGDWMLDLLDRLGVPDGLLPAIRPSLSVLGDLRGSVARSLGLAPGVPVVMGSADTPAASYYLGAHPGGSPLFIMGTTHVISSCFDRPDERAQALQRADVRPGQWLVNGVTNGGDALTVGARLLGYGASEDAVRHLVEDAWAVTSGDLADAPVFVPHVRPERGPLWLTEPRTALLGMTTNTDARAAARGALEGVLFTDRMVIESCVSAAQRPILLSGAFGADDLVPQILADVLDKEIRVVDESHLPSIGAAAMCIETLVDRRVPPPSSRSVHPRTSWRSPIEERWERYRETWSSVVGRPVLERLEYAGSEEVAVHRAGTHSSRVAGS